MKIENQYFTFVLIGLIISFLFIGLVVRIVSDQYEKAKELEINNKMLIYSIAYKEGAANLYDNCYCFQEGVFIRDSINMRNSLK